MDSFHYKTYVHILFSRRKFFNLFIFRRSLLYFNPPTYFPYAKWPQCDPSRKNPVITICMDVLKINYYLNWHVKHMLNFHAFLLIFCRLLTSRWQSLNFRFKTQTLITLYLPYFHNSTDQLKKKITIIRNLHVKNDKFMHRRLSLWCLYALVKELEEHRFLWL